MKYLPYFPLLLAALLAAACSSPTPSTSNPTSAMTPTSPQSPGEGSLRIGQGQFFSYALPPGWRVTEDGQFALVLVAPDNAALTIMVGNSGLMPNYPPAQFVYEKLSSMQVQNLQIGQPRQATPITGFNYAYSFEYSYTVNGVACRGMAKCHVAPTYGMCTMAMTAAASQSAQWATYASWLPQVADQVSASNGGAFGMRGIMQQNLQNSQAYAEAARSYREWSQRNWQQVTDERNASQDRNNFHFRENLGGVQTYTNPYDTRVPVEMPSTYQYYWVDRQGRTWGTNDPGADPNSGSGGDWSRMQRYQP